MSDAKVRNKNEKRKKLLDHFIHFAIIGYLMHFVIVSHAVFSHLVEDVTDE